MDSRNLEKRRQGYYVVKDVPAKLVALVGRKRLRASLHTREHRIALLRRPAALAELEAAIAKAARQTDHTGLMTEALEIRQRLADPAVIEVHDYDGEAVELTAADYTEEIIDHFAAAARRAGHPNVTMLTKVALGTATPIEGLVEPWLHEKHIEERSKSEYRLALRELVDWCAASGRPATLETFDRRTAGGYVTDLRARMKSRATGGKRLSSLSSMWAWLMSKGHVEANVWLGHGMGTPGRADRIKDPERAFTDDELARLLNGTNDVRLVDLMHLGALSGMRLEELAMLRVSDIDTKENTMSVRDPKTPAGRRVVPIHSAALPRIVRRIKDQSVEAFVFPELGSEPKAGRSRSMAVSKRFNRYRKKMKVDDKREGQRRGLVNFHSFRRTFITKAEQADQPESTIRFVVGRKRAGVTFGTYSAGPSLAQCRACVEAVQLPLDGANDA